MQSTDQVLLISPTAFGYNPEAAKDNRFMHEVDEGELANVRRRVMREHENLVDLLGNLKGPLQMTVHLFDHKESHGTPDAVFPNNWFSTAPDVPNFYPMKNENRRKERRKDLVAYLDRQSKCTIDLSTEEEDDPPRYLEGGAGNWHWTAGRQSPPRPEPPHRHYFNHDSRAFPPVSDHVVAHVRDLVRHGQ